MDCDLRFGGRGFLYPDLEELEELVKEEEGPWLDRWLRSAGRFLRKNGDTLVAFVAIYGLLFSFFRPQLIFSVTTTAGGDTGAHHYPAQYLIQELLPNGRLTGWAPGWYAGMPMLTFYFPFPFLLIALFDYILPYTVAFKIATVLGVFALPLTVYAMGRLWRIRKPFPIVAAVLAATFVLMERISGSQLYSIYGGNIPSTLAGEFGYMLSLALVFLFLGTVYRGMEKPRFNMLFVLNCLILMALALSHVVTTVILVFLVPGLMLGHIHLRPGGSKAALRSLGYLVAVGVVGFCLTAFWSLPFVFNLEWTAHMAWNQLPLLGKSLDMGVKIGLAVVGGLGVAAMASVGWLAARKKTRVLPMLGVTAAAAAILLLVVVAPFLSNEMLPRTSFIAVFALGVLGMAFAVARSERGLLPLLWFTAVIFVVFAVWPDGRLWNARFLAFWYLSFHLWAAYAVVSLLRAFKVIVWDLMRLRANVSERLFVPVVAIVAVLIAGLSSDYSYGWINWNYKGYENKSSWEEYKQINDYIDELSVSQPHARVMVEHGDKIDEFGTPRAFEIIPYWTGADTMEGTLMESSYTAAFHFINQRELSEQPSNAIIGVAYPPDIDVTRGITHLQLMNIPYFLAFYNSQGEERVIPAVEADPRARLLTNFGDYNLYEIEGCSGYVEVMKNEPVRVKIEQSEWRDMAVEWYKNPEALDTPLVWDNGQEALDQFASVTPEQAVSPPEVPIETGEYEIWNVQFENERLSFDTTAIGQPHWIKISYFPNWHVEGAEGPFLASPSMMMVIPNQEHVTLYYGRTWANTLGQVLEVLAWALLVGLAVWRLVLRRRGESEPEAVQVTVPSLPGTRGSVTGSVESEQQEASDSEGSDSEEGPRT